MGATIPPLVEVLKPLVVEGGKVVVLIRVDLSECLVKEVVQFITAVVVTAAFTWARRMAFAIFRVILIVIVSATVILALGVAATNEWF